MDIQTQAAAGPDSIWRCLLRHLKPFEEAAMLTDQDIVCWRIDAVERDVAQLCERLGALAASRHDEAELRR